VGQVVRAGIAGQEDRNRGATAVVQLRHVGRAEDMVAAARHADPIELVRVTMPDVYPEQAAFIEPIDRGGVELHRARAERTPPVGIGHRGFVIGRDSLREVLLGRHLHDRIDQRPQSANPGDEVDPLAPGPGRLRGFIGQDLPHHDRQVLEIVGRQPANRHIRNAVIVQVRVPVVGRDLWRRLPTHVDFRCRQERRNTSGAETRVEGSGRFGIANQQDELQMAAARLLANVRPNLLGTERARDEREPVPLGRPMGQPRPQRLQVDGRTDHHRVWTVRQRGADRQYESGEHNKRSDCRLRIKRTCQWKPRATGSFPGRAIAMRPQKQVAECTVNEPPRAR